MKHAVKQIHFVVNVGRPTKCDPVARRTVR
jgi:hypothetical protein